MKRQRRIGDFILWIQHDAELEPGVLNVAGVECWIEIDGYQKFLPEPAGWQAQPDGEGWLSNPVHELPACCQEYFLCLTTIDHLLTFKHIHHGTYRYPYTRS